MLRKRIKITLILAVILIVVAGGGYYFLRALKKSVEYTTAKVERGLLTKSVEATGKIESVDRIELNFKTSGRIYSVLVDSGDRVARGQILAQLEAGALQSQVSNARAQIAQAKADYDKLLAGASGEDIKVTEDTVEQKKQDIITAENNLETLKSKRDTELFNLKDSTLTTAYSELISAQGAAEEIDNTLDDPDAQSTLSSRNSGLLDGAKNLEISANSLISAALLSVNSLTADFSDLAISGAIVDTKTALQKTMDALSKTMDVLLATNTSSDLSEAELDALKTNIKTQQTTISASKASVQSAESSWTNKIAYYEDLVASTENSITANEAALKVAESQLELKKSPPRQFEIDSVKARVDQAEASLNLALANLGDTIIKSPIAGVITKKNFNAGEQSSLSSPVLEMIGESTLQIEVDISESDIADIKAGQPAEVTLDAFSDEEVFLGTVSFVNPAETVIQDVVYYKIKVQLDEQYDEIKPGMTANVKIITAEKEDVLFAPFRAVKAKNGDKYVDVLINNMPEQKIVETGLRGDEGIEILSGVGEGEDVVTFVKEN
ncbi:MAG: efflux RND transporter periplasmic adaptor subunit [Patescibacteria group bacterium]|jgi:HlyD family secretion protein